ncbi:MAG: alanine racemase [Fibrobacterota bacterium]
MSKKRYIKPSLVKQVIGGMNKFGNTKMLNSKEEIGGVNVSSIIAEYGSPAFVFEEEVLRRQYRDAYQAFSTRYPDVQFSWSYKTNYLGAICSLFHQEGEIAEVVSGFEYEKALSLGVDGSDIIFNGPYKTEDELRRAFKNGSMVHLDSFQELYTAEKIAEDLGTSVPVGIRINMDTGTYPRWYKFGFDHERNQAFEAAARIVRSEWLELTGLHSHIGTFMLDSKAYGLQVQKMVALMNRLEQTFDCEISYLDIGGGFPSRNRLKGTYMPPEIAVPDVDDFAEAVCTALEHNLPPHRRPRLYLETGRYMVDEAGSLITTVISQKQLPFNRSAYFVDAGINNLYTGNWYNFDITPARDVDGIPESATIYGPLCMNIDVVAESVYLPPLSVGTPLVIAPVGAYNVTQWMQFITYRPAVVMVMEDGTTELIRRRERLEDVTGPEVVPERLKKK